MKYIIFILSTFISVSALANSGPYFATVEIIQATEIGSPFTTVYLNMDITDSACSSTNDLNRFTLANEAQYSMALTAFSSGKKLKIWGKETCVNDIEQINHMQIWP